MTAAGGGGGKGSASLSSRAFFANSASSRFCSSRSCVVLDGEERERRTETNQQDKDPKAKKGTNQGNLVETGPSALETLLETNGHVKLERRHQQLTQE